MTIDLQELATAIGQLVLRFRMRRRTAADWTSGNEVLLSAEWGLETDTRRKKIGDGVTAWTSLPYDEDSSSVLSVVAGTNVTVDDTDPRNPIVSSTGGGGGGTFYQNPIDVPPVSPDAWDDEFNGSTLDAAWSIVNPTSDGATCTATVSGGSLWVTDDVSSTSQGRLIVKDPPSGDFTIIAKFRTHGAHSYNNVGLGLYDSTGPTNFVARAVVRTDGSPAVTVGYFLFSDPDGLTDPTEINGGVWPTTFYLKMVRNSSNVIYYISQYGVNWIDVGNPPTPTYDKISLYYSSSAPGTVPHTMECEWIRRTA